LRLSVVHELPEVARLARHIDLFLISSLAEWLFLFGRIERSLPARYQ